ncbi:serine/threonine protein kinase [Candidatus Woesearchaeota archaeon]|nr:serine/threonine protein kinase [Candidatus Woesearchaeota archaeon]
MDKDKTPTIEQNTSLVGGGLKGQDSYHLLNPLDEKGRRTYRAVSSATNLECVVKLYTPGSWPGVSDASRQDCFLREKTIQEILAEAERHQNILYTTDIQNQGKYCFVVFPYLRGGDLWTASGVLGPLEPRQSVQVVAGICDGLDHLHRLGVVHRDMKPDNVLLHISDPAVASVRNALKSGTLVPIMSDFEFALHERTRTYDHGMRGILGTAQYISPEMWKRLAVDCRSDIYGAGIIFFEILTGHYPFVRSGGDPNFMRLHLKASMRDPRRFNRKITPGMCTVLEKAIAKDPDQRYQTVRQLKDDYLNAVEMKTNS